MAKWDFPSLWPDAFQQLIGIMSITQDVQLQKLYLKFIVQVLITLDEELVERYEGTGHLHNECGTKVKDGIREIAIDGVCLILKQALFSFEQFDTDTINECLRVSAQLIDWNSLEHFTQIVLIAKSMLEQCMTN